jgi:hypothetical protein
MLATGSEKSGPALRNVAMVAAGLTAASFVASRPALAVSPALTFNDITGTGDVKVLNYALALEALESDLYAQAILRLTTGGTNAVGKTIPGLGLDSSQPDVQYITEFAQVELQHRNYLNAALGTASIIATGGALATAMFDFGFDNSATNSRQQVLELIYTAESTGVQAYLGAIQYLSAKSPYLATAGAIQGTEARHTATIAIVFNLLGFTPLKDTAPLVGQTTTIYGKASQSGIDGTLDPNTVLAAVSPYIVL